MESRGAILRVSGARNCFIKIPSSWTANIDKNRVQSYKVQSVEDGGGVLYTTWQGDVSSSSTTETVEISGMFSAKQGFSDGAEVLVTRLDSIPTCERLFVEPVSVDDWEILELHAEYLEQHLLDQVRLAWNGQVMPLWVNNKICIFVRVDSVEPQSNCCLLEQLTELHIAPKDRRPIAPVQNKPAAAKQSSDVKHNYRPQQAKTSIKDGSSSNTSNLNSTVQNMNQWESGNVTNANTPSNNNNEDVVQRLMNYFHGLLFGGNTPPLNGSSVRDEAFDEYTYKREILGLDGRQLKISYRTQPCVVKEPGKGNTDVDIPPIEILNQPTCVYIYCKDFKTTLAAMDLPLTSQNHIPRTFLATIAASKTPAERDQELTKQMLNKKPLGTETKPNAGANNLPTELLDESQVMSHIIVRVVLLDSGSLYSLRGPSGTVIARASFGDGKGPLAGHVIVGDLLRRQMSLPVTGRVCLQALQEGNESTDVSGITLHPLFNVPAGFTEEMMTLAFKAWIRDVTCLDCPLVISNGTMVKYFLKQDLYGEFLITLDNTKMSSSPGQVTYCLLHYGMCEDLTIKVVAKMIAPNKPRNIQLPCWNLTEIDPKLPAVSLQQLGGVKELFDEVRTHLQVALAVRPIDKLFMDQQKGLRSGAVLLSGPKGSGKSTLARAICRSLAELPPLAHVSVIDCKPLRGKRVDAIQKTFSKAFAEAAWRQPAVLLFDDLDHIAAAPSGPEQEMSGEAVYFNKIAEAIKDLFQREISDNSAVVVIATCKAHATLNATLTTSRGHHFCQKTVHISPPDKMQRKAMLESLLTFRSGLKDDLVRRLDLDKVAGQTEGHVVRDLEQIVDRALHAQRMRRQQDSKDKTLQDGDFQAALHGFTPMGLRNVTLHDSGEVSWDNVGGLHEVRHTLIETLQWPSKYPQLFASCPLRLRAGVLLYGAPGTGKTLLAAAVAKECGLNFISIKGPELLSKYIGASEQSVRDTFERAQSAKPCILFFDEFDSLAPRRGHDNTGVTDRVVNQLLTQLDGVEGLEGVYVLAATSRPDLIDPALLRPGRLDKALLCTLPTEAERIEILKILSKQMSLSPDVNLQQVASLCNYFTGADLKALLYNAQLAAIHETTDLWASTLHNQPSKSVSISDKIVTTMKKNTSEQDLKTSTSFEHLLPESGTTAQRERYNSSLSEGSSGSDISAGQSASWEVVADLSDKAHNGDKLAVNNTKTGSTMLAVADKSVEKAETSDKVKVVQSQLVAYMPRLEDGMTAVSQRRAEELLNLYQKRSVQQEKAETKSLISTICQRHLSDAAKTMQPSVSENERRKFNKIYENFVSSKGGGFGSALTEGGQRATLA